MNAVSYTEAVPDAISPYRIIGARRLGGGSGGSNLPPVPAAQWRFLHTDHLGSPRVVVDDGGDKISAHHYIPFGDEKPLAGALTSNHMKFTGHERDVESASFDDPDGLDYMMARYYSSSLGRFMAVDPGDDTALEDPQSWNKYAYVGNNPINATDPTGEASTKQKILVAGAVALAVADGPLPIGDVAASLIIATAMTLEGPKPPAPDGKPDDAPKPDAGADKKDDSDGSKKAKDRRAEEQEADKSQRRGAPDWEPPASDREGKDAGKDVEKEAGGGDKGKDARRQYHDEKGPGGDRTKKELKEDKKIVQPKPNP